jgi:ABC-type branched-subunit amino acid transport system substrate-binding protein
MLRLGRSSVAAIAVAALLLSACGSASKPIGGSSGQGSGSITPSTSVTSNAPKGTPIKIATLEDVGTPTGQGYDAGVKLGLAAVNAAGGIHGHPIQLVNCTDNFDVSVATNCVRSAIADPNVVALVGTGSGYGGQIDPMLTSGSMASIGNSPLTPADYTCSVCFANGVGATVVLGMANAAVSVMGAKAIADPEIAAPAGAGVPALLRQFLDPKGVKVVGTVSIPITAADVTPYAAAVGAAKPDAVMAGLTTDLIVKFLHAYRGQGFNTPFFMDSLSGDPTELSAELSGVDSNLYVLSNFSHSGSGYQTFLSDFQRYNHGYAYHDDGVLKAYLAVKEFAFAAGRGSDLTRAGILQAMNSLSSYDGDGLISPPLDYTHTQTAGNGQFPRLFKSTGYLYKLVNGTLEPMNGGKAIDIFTGQTAQ